MCEIAPQADLWYNKHMNNVLPERCYQHPQAWTNLFRRFVMDTLPPYAHDGNPTKICSKCKRELPATTEYFARHKSHKDGFQSYCKQCRSIAKPKYTPLDGYKLCSKCKRELPATQEYFGWRIAYKGRKPGLDSHCKQCKSENDRNYRAKHSEKIKTYRESISEQRHINNKKYRQDHSNEIKTRMTRYREEHREESRMRSIAHRQSERGKAMHRADEHNRRARKLSIGGTHTHRDIQMQYERQKGKCYYCRKKVKWGDHHADHTFPISRVAGTDIPANDISFIVITCRFCNESKKDKFPWEWPQGGRLL